MTEVQIVKSPSRPDGRGRRNLSRQQSCVGMGKNSINSSHFYGSLYLRESSRLAGSPLLEQGLTSVSNSRRRELIAILEELHQSRAAERGDVAPECPPSIP